MDGPKDPWPRVLSLPRRFIGDPASLARDNVFDHQRVQQSERCYSVFVSIPWPLLESRTCHLQAFKPLPVTFYNKGSSQSLKLHHFCGSPPGVIVADTLSFNAKMDLVDF